MGAALACALVGAATFQFFGNANRGYIDTASVFYWWGFQWFNAGSETEHGPLILAISAWLWWRNLRLKEASDSERPSTGVREPQWPALAAMLLGLALHGLGFAAQQTRLSILALLVFTWGVLRLAGGRKWGRAAVFPLGFLVFALPLNVLDSVGFWLRLWVIHASTALAHAAGIGVLASGTQLLAPDGSYQYDVAAACSGVRSLMALAALSLLVGYLSFRSGIRRALVLTLCFPLVYLGNLARISAIIFAAHWGGQHWGERLHTVMGFAVFAIVLGGVLLAVSALQRWWPEAEEGTSGKKPETAAPEARTEWLTARSALGVVLVVMVFGVGEMAFLHRLESQALRGLAGVRVGADARNPVELPTFLGSEWIGRRTEVTALEREILPPDTGFSRKLYVPIADPAGAVFLSIVLSGRDRTSIHRPELCLVGQGWTLRDSGSHRFAYPNAVGGDFPATVLRVQREVVTARGREVVPSLVVYWFVGGDRVVATHWQRIMHDAWSRVRYWRADRWAYVLMQTDARGGEAAALARMQAVLNQTLPVFQLQAAERPTFNAERSTLK